MDEQFTILKEWVVNDSLIIRLAENIPFVNLIYDTFIDEPPSLDVVKEMLSMLALVDALMVGSIISVVSSVNYDEILASDIRWTTKPTSNSTSSFYYNYWMSGNNPQFSYPIYSPSVTFSKCVALSMFGFFVSLIGVFIIYLDTLGKNFADRRIFELWWHSVRISLIICTTTTVVGIMYSAACIECLAFIKIPDLHCTLGTLAFSSDPTCVGAFQCFVGYLAFWAVVPLIVCIDTFGTSRAFWQSRKTSKKYFKEKDDNEEEDIERKCIKNSDAEIILDEESPGKSEAEIIFKFIGKIWYKRPEVYGPYIRFFWEHEIVEKDLKFLTNDSLKDLGIIKISHRLQVLEAIKDRYGSKASSSKHEASVEEGN